MNTEAERQREYRDHQRRNRERVDAEPARGLCARGHVEAARSCAMPERANVGDAKAPKPDTGLVGLTLGQRG